MKKLSDYILIQRIDQALLLFLILAVLSSCSSGKRNTRKESALEIITTRAGDAGIPVQVEFRKGPSHNHPLMAIWVEDTLGNYLETLYVAASIGTGIFGHGKVIKGVWEPGPLSRPAALPYWWHKYGRLPTPDTKVPDAISGPTPSGDFVLNSRMGKTKDTKVNMLFEINQSWDWNEYWTNDKFPGDADYLTSSQPAVVYMVCIDLTMQDTVYTMDVIGHSHYSGKDGRLYEDISSLTTALDIAGVIKVNTGNE